MGETVRQAQAQSSLVHLWGQPALKPGLGPWAASTGTTLLWQTARKRTPHHPTPPFTREGPGDQSFQPPGLAWLGALRLWGSPMLVL